VVEIVPALPEEVAVLRDRQLAAVRCLLETVAANRAGAMSRRANSFRTAMKPDRQTSRGVQGGVR
jgi:hypothetical protein